MRHFRVTWHNGFEREEAYYLALDAIAAKNYWLQQYDDGGADARDILLEMFESVEEVVL